MAEAQMGRLADHNLETRADLAALANAMRPSREGLPVNLLVVDDDEHIREVCRTVAAECGITVMDVSTAEEALELLELSSVDILLTDLRLPGTSGLDLLKRVTVTHPTKPFRVAELRAPRTRGSRQCAGCCGVVCKLRFRERKGRQQEEV